MGSGVVIAVAIGIGIAVQTAIVGRGAPGSSPLAVSLALQLSGVAAATVWATTRGRWAEVTVVARQWWWVPLGIVGWVVVAGLAHASRRIGVAPTLGIAVAAQLITALVIDAARADHAVPVPAVVGALLVLAGVVVLGLSA
jgi:uncharacterized membrane protein YdcZ (DUF606 family)